jgi:hypothetical protein
MTKLYYRGMMADNGKPKIGRQARCLGIRPNIDIDVERVPKDWINQHGYLRPSSENDLIDTASLLENRKIVEVAIRNKKGMSVSLSIDALPDFRRPAAFGGTGRDPLWQIDRDQITGDLEAIQDSATHVSIMPKGTMILEQYEAALASTSDAWELV